ncbi:hypothetical protein AMTRI_Chr05g70960 [Amborella trichopoda]
MASFSKLVTLPFLAKKLTNNLTNLNVPCAGLLKEKLVVTTRWVKEVLDLEELASIEKNPSIRLLLRFYPGPPNAMDLAKRILKDLKANLLLQQSDDIVILERNIQKIESLLVMAREVEEDPSSSQLEHGEYPPFFINTAHLKVVVLKDKIRRAQQDCYRLNHVCDSGEYPFL